MPGRYTHITFDASARALFLPAGVLLITHAGIFFRRRTATLTSLAYEFCRRSRTSFGPRFMCFALVVLFGTGAVMAVMPVVDGR